MPDSTGSSNPLSHTDAVPVSEQEQATARGLRGRLLPVGGGLLAAGLLLTLATVAGAPTPPAAAPAAAPAAVPAAPSADLAQAAALDASASAKLVAAGKAQQAAAQQAARVAKIAAANRTARAARAEAAKRGPSAQGKTAASAPERRTGRTVTASGPGGAKSLARDMVASRGWGSGEFRCLERLWEKESNWKHTARNSSSGAYGIPQSLPGHKMASAGSDWRTNPATQIRWGLDYIADRYNRPCNAWAHSQRVNWY